MTRHEPARYRTTNGKSYNGALTRAPAAEIGTDGVTANVIAPALTNTPTMKGVNQDIFDYLPKMQAIPRFIQPDDLAGVVSFLCSKDSGFVTGQTLAADGGQVRN